MKRGVFTLCFFKKKGGKNVVVIVPVVCVCVCENLIKNLKFNLFLCFFLHQKETDTLPIKQTKERKNGVTQGH